MVTPMLKAASFIFAIAVDALGYALLVTAFFAGLRALQELDAVGLRDPLLWAGAAYALFWLARRCHTRSSKVLDAD